MNFPPKTEEQLQLENLIEEGTFLFEVVSAEEKLSQAGNEMIQMNLKVYDSQGNSHHIFDFLMEAMGFKLLHFCNAVGLSEIYKAGRLTAQDCEYKTGMAVIKHQKDKRDTDKLRAFVYDYKESDIHIDIPFKEEDPGIADDDLPFI